MMAALRRTRWIATLLLALAPGAGGQVVAALHPCPADAAATPPAHGGMAAAHHAAAPADGHRHPGGGECSCVGLCCAPAMATAPTGFQVLVPVQLVPASAIRWVSIDAFRTLPPLPERFPPKTAPPLA
jgi:hypothetical protein